MKQSGNAITNLINRYRAVLKKCHLLNTFGSLAVCASLLLGAVGGAMLNADVAEAYDWTTNFNVDNGVYYLKNGGYSPNAIIIGYYTQTGNALIDHRSSYLSAIIDNTVVFGDSTGTAQDTVFLSYSGKFPISILDGNQLEVKYDPTSASTIEVHNSGILADFNKTKFQANSLASNAVLANRAVITKISADFIQNSGLAIRNFSGATIDVIDSNFIENGINYYDEDTLNSPGSTAISNEGTIGTITGSFLRNRGVRPEVAYGGAIINSGIITSIDAHFVSNAIVVNSDRPYANWDFRGGAIANTGSSRIGSISGDFIDNSIYAQYIDPSASRRIFIRGGAIYNEGSNGQVKISGNFIANNIFSNVITQGAFNLSGGAVYNSENMIISGGDFISNKIIAGGSAHGTADVEAYRHVVRGGAVYNSGVMTIADAEFNNNIIDYKYSIVGGSTAFVPTVQGAAIYNSGTLTLNALSEDVLFIGNTIKNYYNSSDNRSEAIYNTNRVNIHSSGDNQVITYDDFNGDGTYIIAGALNLRGDANFSSDAEVLLGDYARISIIDSQIQNKTISGLNHSKYFIVGVDTDLSTGQTESITQSGAGRPTIGMLNVLGRMSESDTDRRVTVNSGTGNHFYYDVDVTNEAFGNNGFYRVVGSTANSLTLFESIADTLDGALRYNQKYKGYYFNQDETSAGGDLVGTNLEILSNNNATLTLSSDFSLESDDSLTLTNVKGIEGSRINTNGADFNINNSKTTTFGSSISGAYININEGLSTETAVVNFDGDVSASTLRVNGTRVSLAGNNKIETLIANENSKMNFTGANNTLDSVHAVVTGEVAFNSAGTVNITDFSTNKGILKFGATGAGTTVNFTTTDSEIDGVDGKIEVTNIATFTGTGSRSKLDGAMSIANGANATFNTMSLDTVTVATGATTSFTNTSIFSAVLRDSKLTDSSLVRGDIYNITINGNNSIGIGRSVSSPIESNILGTITNNGTLTLDYTKLNLIGNITGGILVSNNTYNEIRTNDATIDTHSLGTLADNFEAGLSIDATIDFTGGAQAAVTSDSLTIDGLAGTANATLRGVNFTAIDLTGAVDGTSYGIVDIFTGANADALVMGVSSGLKVSGATYDLTFADNTASADDKNDIRIDYASNVNSLNKLLNETTSPRTYRMSADENAGDVSNFTGDMTVSGDGLADYEITGGTITFANSAGNELLIDHVFSSASINFTGSSEANKNILNIRSNGAGNTLTTAGMIQTLPVANYAGNEVNFIGTGKHEVNASIGSSTVNIAALETNLNRGMSYSTVNIMGATNINTSASDTFEDNTFNVGATTIDNYGLGANNTVNIMANVDGTSGTVYTTTESTDAAINLLGANSGAVNEFVIDSTSGAVTVGSVITSTSQANIVKLTGTNVQTLNSALSNVTIDVNSTGTNTFRGPIDNSIMNIDNAVTSSGAITNSVLNVNTAMSGTSTIADSDINVNANLTSGKISNSTVDMLAGASVASVIDGSEINVGVTGANFTQAITNSKINIDDVTSTTAVNSALGNDVTVNMNGSTNVNTFVVESTSGELTTSANFVSADNDNVLHLDGAGTHRVLSELSKLTVNASVDTVIGGNLNTVALNGAGAITLDNISTDNTVTIGAGGARTVTSSSAVTTGATANVAMTFTGSGDHTLIGNFGNVNINGIGTNTIENATFGAGSTIDVANSVNLSQASFTSAAQSLDLANNATVSTRNNAIDTINLDDFTAGTDAKLNIDFNVETPAVDNFTLAGSGTGQSIFLDNINFIGSFDNATAGSLNVFDKDVLVNLDATTYYTSNKSVEVTASGVADGSIGYSVGAGATLNTVAGDRTGVRTYELTADEDLSLDTTKLVDDDLTVTGAFSITGSGFTGEHNSSVTFQDVASVDVTAIALGQNVGDVSSLIFENLSGGSTTINANISSVNPTNTVTFSDGYFTANGTLSNVNADVQGYVERTNIDTNVNYTLAGSLSYTDDAFLGGRNNSINFNGGRLNLANGKVTQGIALNAFSLANNTNSSISLDADLVAETMDTVNATTVAIGANATLNVDRFNILADAPSETAVVIDFTDDTALQAAITSTNTAQGYSPIYKYNVDYDTTNGEFSFTRSNAAKPVANFNPDVFASSIGKVAHINAISDVSRRVLAPRQVMNLEDRNGVSGGSGASPSFFKSAWVEAYGSTEDVHLDGMTFDSDNYGAIVGADSRDYQMGSWTSSFSLYAGSINSSQKYKSLDIDQHGFVLGASLSLRNESFYSITTANFASSYADADTSAGSEEFNMQSFSIVNKTGVKWQVADSNFVIEPALLIGYSYVHTSDYSSASNVQVKSEDTHVLTINPEIKASYSFDNGITPYASVGYIFNSTAGSEVSVNNIALPNLQVDQYFEFTLGVDAEISDNFSAFAEANATTGDREGFGFQVGFELKF